MNNEKMTYLEQADKILRDGDCPGLIGCGNCVFRLKVKRKKCNPVSRLRAAREYLKEIGKSTGNCESIWDQGERR